jgi:catechol 2,3-dioxygenase-like lactoylglutathione lyase family enzyme
MQRVDGIAFVTGNVTRSLAFYRLLGFDVPSPPGSDSYATTVRDGVRLSWTTPDGSSATARCRHRSGSRGELRLMLRCACPAEVDVLARTIRNAGYTIEEGPVDVPWGAHRCSVRDPDGNVLELFAPLP